MRGFTSNKRKGLAGLAQHLLHGYPTSLVRAPGSQGGRTSPKQKMSHLGTRHKGTNKTKTKTEKQIEERQRRFQPGFEKTGIGIQKKWRDLRNSSRDLGHNTRNEAPTRGKEQTRLNNMSSIRVAQILGSRPYLGLEAKSAYSNRLRHAGATCIECKCHLQSLQHKHSGRRFLLLGRHPALQCAVLYSGPAAT